MNLRIVGEGVPMKQTDLQGETERALRAITCEGCRLGLPIEMHVYGLKRTPVHFKGVSNEGICTSKYSELLPLFNAGIFGAYAAAAKHHEITISGEPGSIATHRGACSCGGLVADGVTPWAILWERHILALTPADARLAQEQLKRTQFVAGLTEARRQYADQAAAIASAEARARMEEAKLWSGSEGSTNATDHEYHFTFYPECTLCSEARIVELTIAARTPDSTKEPE